jgi:hypothetical protein
MKFIRMLSPTLFALLALSAAGASAAEAAGPVWINGLKEELKATEHKTISVIGNLSVVTLEASSYTVECSKVSKGTHTASEIIGGNPGTGKAEILYKECHHESQPNCLATGTEPVGAAGEIIAEFKTLLVYIAGQTNGERALEAFFPVEGHLNLVTNFKFENKPGTTECGSLNGTEVHVAAVGTEIEIPTFKEKRRCAMAGEVGEVASGKFKPTKPGEVSLKGALNFPSFPAEYWTGTEFVRIECSMQDIVGMIGVTDEEHGELDVTLEGTPPFGWAV